MQAVSKLTFDEIKILLTFLKKDSDIFNEDVDCAGFYLTTNSILIDLLKLLDNETGVVGIYDIYFNINNTAPILIKRYIDLQK